MSMKKIALSIVMLLLVIIGYIFFNFHSEKKQVKQKVDDFIIEKNYKDHIEEQEMLYDWKTGSYYAKVIFEDEPQNYYEFYVDSDSHDVYVIGFNDERVEITNRNEGKYIDDRF